MPILTIRHVTTYRNKRPVAFGEHRMMPRPRDDDDQKVLSSELEITPAPRQLTWTQDIFGNHVATARFAERASELRFESAIRLDHAPADFRAADIEDFAQTHPFAYAADDMPGLTPFIGPRSTHPELDRWAARFLRADGSANSRELLVDMTQTIKRTFKHVARPALPLPSGVTETCVSPEPAGPQRPPRARSWFLLRSLRVEKGWAPPGPFA